MKDERYHVCIDQSLCASVAITIAARKVNIVLGDAKKQPNKQSKQKATTEKVKATNDA